MTADFAAIEEGIELSERRSSNVVVLESPQHRLERVVLASIAHHGLDAAAELNELEGEDFTSPRHRAQLAGITDLLEQGERVTVASLGVVLEQLGHPLTFRAAPLLDALLAQVEPLDALRGLVAQLKETRARATARSGLARAQADLQSSAPSAAAVTEQLLQMAASTQDASRWPDPVPLGAGLAPAWPKGILRGPLASLVEALAESYQVPVDLPAMMGLGVISACIGGRFQVSIRRGWREPTNVFLAIAMPPASRKSGIARALTKPLVDWERRLSAQVANQVHETASALRVAEKELARYEDAVARAKSEGEREDANLRRESAVTALATAQQCLVRSPRLITDDATPEALTSLLAEHGGRFALISAEGGGIFDMMAGGRYASVPNLDVYLKGHACDPIRVDRKGRPAEFIRDPALTVAVATQPDTLRVFASRPELRGRGLPARFLYSVPLSNVGHRSVEPELSDPVIYHEWSQLVRDLLGHPPSVDEEGHTRPHRIELDEDAQAHLTEWAREVEERLRDRGDLAVVADWGGKLVGATVRVAGLLHAAEHSLTLCDAPIDGDTMERAIFLAKEYLVPHAVLAFEAMGETPAIANGRKLLAWAARTKTASVGPRDVLKAFGGRGDRKGTIDPIIDVLKAHGWVREQESQKAAGRGRPAERWTIHPSVFRGAL
ncbi:MAG: DUF3987 domain-containing protein [Myxococcales bacterium]|nr:DUF3987 domain-containing protein [Myxococcales bacterium]